MNNRWLLRAVVFISLAIAWELAVRATGTPDRYPIPSKVCEAALSAVSSGPLFVATGQSLARVLIAFAYAAVGGIAIGAAIALSPTLNRGLSPIIDALRSIAPIAWIPLAVLWFGIRGEAAIFIVAYAAIFPIILNTAEAIRLLDHRLVAAARTLGAGRLWLFWSVVLRAAAPGIIVGARIAMGFAWASIVAAELAMGIKLNPGEQSEVGLGQLMVRTLYVDKDVNSLVVYMLTIGVVGLIIDFVMKEIYKRYSPWIAT